MNISVILNEANNAANVAQNDYLAQYGEQAYCGFAWVEVYVDRVNSKEANVLKDIGFKKNYKPKVLSLWSPGNYKGQSMDILYAGAQAFAKVLRMHGFKAYAGSRAD